jgi:hypothetical protein
MKLSSKINNEPEDSSQLAAAATEPHVAAVRMGGREEA